MLDRKSFFLIVIFVCATLMIGSQQAQSQVQDEFDIYKMKRHDSVSKIIQQKNIGPLFGKGGQLKKVMKLNRLNNDLAKTLVPGDVLVLPAVPTLPIVATDKKELDAMIKAGNADKLQVQAAATQKSEAAIGYFGGRRNKRHHSEFRAGYFFRQSHLDSGENFKNRINLRTAAAYRYNNLDFRDWAFAPSIEGTLYMQNISDGGTGKTVDQRKELNNLITAGLGIHDKRHSLTLTPIMEREQYSRIVKSEDGYAAKRDSEVRAGLSLSKYGHFDAFGNEYLAWALLSWASGPATRNSRIYFRTGMDFTPKLGLEFFGEQYSYIKDSERMQSFGLAGVFKL